MLINSLHYESNLITDNAVIIFYEAWQKGLFIRTIIMFVNKTTGKQKKKQII